MFTTFYGVAPPTPGGGGDDANAKANAATNATRTPANRPKRSQVRRACDWCKLMRIKCDNHRPCSSCRQADRDCTVSGEDHFRSLAEAVNEVKRLRAQVRAFETAGQTVVAAEQQQQQQQQQQEKQHTRPDRAEQRDNQQFQENPATQVRVPNPDSDARPRLYPKNSPRKDKPAPPSASRNGIRVDSIPYDVTSLPFFLARMNEFLKTTQSRSQPQPDLDILQCASLKGSRGSRSPAPHENGPYPQQDMSSDNSYGYLPRAQESLFLDLFWQTHYFSFPILNEGQFRKDYNALWAASSPGEPRKASPLVDIVVALCIQVGGFLVRQSSQASDPGSGTDQNNESSPDDLNTPSLGGFQYYRRCQESIDRMIESPSIDTVHCYIFSIVYLYEAGLLNGAHVAIGKAIMMAMILGLPYEPEADVPEPQKEVARRTWWSLYILDVKLSMEVGRPPMIDPSHSTCRLPSDSNEVARWLGPHYSFDDSCPTWLGFQTQTLRLLDAVRCVRSVLYTKYDAVVGENGYKDFVSNAAVREECAYLLTAQMKELSAWARQVPDGYLVARHDGQSFSTDRERLEFEVDMIIHCQRQRLLLELQYHQCCMSLYQPFICFAPAADGLTPVSDGKAEAALAHAMTLTAMVHQTLTNTEALSGVYHVFRWQKNALFTMLGFAYTFPIKGLATATRKSIEMAIAVVDMYRDVLPEAGRVATIARALAEEIGAVVPGLSTGSNGWSSLTLSSSAATASMASAFSTPGTRSDASDVQTATLMNNVPMTSSALSQQDQNMVTISCSTDTILDGGFLHQFVEEGNNIEAMDILWASLDTSDVSNVNSWMPISHAMPG
ncbi:fungal-specific transcription factor domain-containing protein [Nemania serpens]|nr:fungal-specific transcription factor domain-containing protein [Nemania serpens]